jgi:putative transposase
MPRRPRQGTGGHIFHVVNRAAARRRLFACPDDYELVLETLGQAQRRVPIRILSYIIMPNHWHLALWPEDDTTLSRFMHRFTSTHAQRWHAVAGSTGAGALYQARFKAFPMCTDDYMLTCIRYIERNAQAAGLVQRARDWAWSSLWQRLNPGGVRSVVLAPWPLQAPDDWVDLVETPLDAPDRMLVRNSMQRGAPLGPRAWRQETAQRLGLEATLREREDLASAG